VQEAIQLRLPRASKISGVVRTPEGKLAGKARVTARHGEGKTSQAETENGGEYTVTRIQPGKVTLTARADGWASSLPIELDLAPGDKREDYIIYLRNGGTIEVELHASQEPREGRQVTLSGTSWNRKTTDADGKVRFTGLEPGNYTVQLREQNQGGGRRGGRGGSGNWVLRNANQIEAEVTLEDEQVQRVVLGEPPPNAVTVRGRVTSNGEPVGGALITVTPKDGSEAEAACEAEPDGTYELMLPEPGEWRFLVGRQWGQQSNFNETVPSGPTHQLDFELPEGRLLGTVRGPDGSLQNNVTLSLTRVEDGREVDTGWLGRRQANTDSEGNYRFDEVAPGTYNLRAAHGGRNRRDPTGLVLVTGIEIEAEVTRDVQLPRAGAVTGNVVDTSGSPVAGARVEIQSLDGFRVTQGGTERADDSGEFEIDGLGPGTLRVRARSSGGWGEWKEVRVREQGEANVTLVAPVPTD
jgi:protocatechuate 3,4-dioxygenase beta subunit